MAAQDTHVPLHGSEPHQPTGAVEKAAGKPPHDELIELDILVKSRRSTEELAFDVEAMSDRLPAEREYLDHDEFEKRYGADPDCLERLKAFADRWGLEIVRMVPATRLVVVRGTAAALERAFRIEFTALRMRGKMHRSFRGLVHVPRELQDIVEAVFGLDNKQMWDRNLPRDTPSAGVAPSGPSPSLADRSYVERFYQFPETTSGKGQTLGVILLANGYFPDDLDTYFTRAGLKRPEVKHVLLGGAQNTPYDRNVIRAWIEAYGFAPPDPSAKPVDWDALGDPRQVMSQIMWTIEATLDLQLIGTFANDAKIVVYFATNDERGKVNALATALGDKVHNPSVISCSWGAVEDKLNDSLVRSMDRLLQAAALRGVTVCYSSGDRGADRTDDIPHVQFPASSPHVLSCGGTILDTHRRSAEIVWNEVAIRMSMASGGGFSNRFAKPDWQRRAIAEFDGQFGSRGVPDVAGKADMADGYPIVVAGHTMPMGGTSAAAPVWAALIARLNEALGKRVGWLTPLLYRDEFRRALQPISQGTDGFYPAKPGWDPCTGCGTPRGRGLLDALRGH